MSSPADRRAESPVFRADPLAVLRALPRGGPVVLLHRGMDSPAAGDHSVLAISPRGILRAPANGLGRENVEAGIFDASSQSSDWLDRWFGFFTFEWGVKWVDETVITPAGPLPDAWWMQAGALYLWDHAEESGRILARNAPAYAVMLQAVEDANPPPLTTYEADIPRPLIQYPAYEQAILAIREHLLAGDIYQANFTLPFECGFAGDPRELFIRLAAQSPAPWAAYIDAGDFQVICNSPELLLDYDPQSRLAVTRPIKGTRPRGSSPEEDQRLAAELRASEKDRAEHVMIVDLERNDLGKVCEYGGVQVPVFMETETFPTVHHLTSTVTGRVRADVTGRQVLEALYPGGSITGAPKRRAMEILRGLEAWPRSVYCGGLGWIAPTGAMKMALPIRTGYLSGGRFRFHAGGGIVVDSDPRHEWDEVHAKTAAIRRALGAGGRG
ncbi:MAG: Isochorismate synthase MenF [Myxococcota bacterium]|nr:Isochorismate synthase MenF [Myxococcota bacterium]